MFAENYIVTLYDPEGTPYDLTDRTDEEEGFDLSEAVEIGLTELTHDDLSITLDDHDGFIARLFDGVQPDEEWTLLIHRSTGTSRRDKWDLMFGGLVDVVFGIQDDPLDKKVELQVFSFTKVLERASAESVRRDFDQMAGGTTGGTKNFTSSSTRNMQVGDTIQFASGSTTEAHTIESVNPGVGGTTVENWSNTFVNADITITTPYYRNKSASFVANELYQAAGITEREVETDEDVSEEPFLTAVNKDGLPDLGTFGTVRCLLDHGGKITMGLNASPQRQADSPQSGFVDGDATTSCYADWRPYYDFDDPEPSLLAVAGVLDNGSSAWDHDNGDRYSIQFAGSYPNLSLRILKNGVLFVSLASAQKVYSNVSMDFWPGRGAGETPCLLISWIQIENGTNIIAQFFGQVDIATATYTNIRTGENGTLRTIYAIRRVAYIRGGQIEFMQQAGTTWGAAETTILDKLPQASLLQPWTMRAMRLSSGQVVLFLTYSQGPYSGRARIFKYPQFTTISDTEVSALASTLTPFATVWADSDGEQYGILLVGETLLVLSTKFAGVIEYADFTSMSTAAGLKEVALMCGCYVTVDPDRFGRLIRRITTEREEDPPVLDEEGNEPEDLERLPIWEDFRASVVVKGTRSDGIAVEATAGDPGDSARRLTVSPKWPITSSMAGAIASSLFLYCGKVRRQRTGTWTIQTRRYRPMDHVRFESEIYRIVEADTDGLSGEQDLRLIEIMEQS